MMGRKSRSDTAYRLIDFLAASPTPWHAVQTAVTRLEEHGFVAIDEAGEGALAPGAKGYLRRSGTLIAFRVGRQSPVKAGFRLTSAHTDSPNLRLKPQPILRSQGWVRLGVEVYGGVILATWADRDLGMAGQVVVRDKKRGQRTALVDLRRPLCRIPNLAIHLNRQVNEDGLKINAQTQLPAVLALDNDGSEGDPVRKLLATELGCSADDVLTWDLCLYDLTAPTIGGLNDEFVFSARLDNQASCHAALEALIAAADDEPPDTTAVIALFDHEEIGSTSSRGATSRLLEGVLTRIVRDTGGGSLERAFARSVHLSSDMAHAVHPAYPDKHEPNHLPMLNAGPVIKQNSNQRYGTEAETSALVVRLCEAAGVRFQWFVNRTDLACGSTVGPLVAAQLGVPTVDVGNPMLSMHSAREMCGTKDQKQMILLMRGFLAGGPD
jgi:aspartyl aminopeptidase